MSNRTTWNGGVAVSQLKVGQQDSDSIEVKKQKELIEKTIEIRDSLINLVKYTHDIERLKKIEMYFDWLITKTSKVNEEPTFDANTMPCLNRGDVILIDLGFNVGEEYGGKHAAIVLRNSNQSNKRVVVLPITSQEPVNKKLTIYVKIGKIAGLVDDRIHWANIFNVCAISKQRIIYPPEPKQVDGKVLNRISGAIKSQIALR